MKNNLRISNMIFTGRIWEGVKLNPKEVRRLIQNGKLDWMIVNEEISPMISAHIPRPKKEIGVRGKLKCFYVTIWTSGFINIVGVRSRKEADFVYSKVLRDLKKLCPRVFR